MPPSVASIIFALGIAGLFFIEGLVNSRGSKALWIPAIWLFFCSSRSLGQWLGVASSADEAGRYLDGSPIDRNFLLVIELIALIIVISRIRRTGSILGRNWPIVLFFVYAGFSIAWSDYPVVTLKHWTKGIGDILIVLIVLSEPDVQDAVRRLTTRVGFVLVPLSLLLIWYYPQFGRTHTMDWSPEAVGVATQKNGLGELCDLYGLALVWRFRAVWIDRKLPRRIWRLLAIGSVLVMIVWLLHLCNSLTSICALCMGTGVMLASNHAAFLRRRSLVHFMIAGVIACTLYALFFQSSGTLIQGLGRDSTLSGRTSAWPQFISLVNNPIIGVGYESFWLGDRLQKVYVITQGLHINEAHNGYVEVFLTLGVCGLVLLGILLVTGYRNVFAAYRRDAAVGSLRLAWFLAVIITGLTEAAFRIMGLPWILFLVATAAASWAPQKKTSKSVAPIPTQTEFEGVAEMVAQRALRS